LNIAFGVERIGLFPLRDRQIAIVVAIVPLIAALFGAQRIQIDDSLSQLFRAKTPEFEQFQEVSRRFPSNEYDVLVVVEGKIASEARVDRETSLGGH
jgi:predicted RND superfamily exporter protein